MATPLLDIVMLVHNRADWADLSIRAVENLTKNPYRLIIIDMASTEPKVQALLKHCEEGGHTVVRLQENRSFSHGVNTGVNLGTAPYICVLNDDAIVTDGWDGALIQDASPKNVGLVGARSNYAAGPQMMPGFQGEPPFLVFVCVALRREVWEKVGPMDEENFGGFSSEDLDYCWQVKKAGYNLALSSAYVLHAGSRTLAATLGDQAALNRNNEKWNQVLIDKWGKEWIASHTKLRTRCLVASFHAEEWTRVNFAGALINLRGGGDPSGGNPWAFDYYQHSRTPIHAARQLVCDFALDNGYDYLVMIDDDATFPPDLLRRLMAHQKDVVCCLAYQRKAPYFTCVFEYVDGGPNGIPMDNIEHTGLRRVDVSGFHCSMIKTSIIKKLRDGVKDADGKVLVPGTRSYFGGFGTTGEKDAEGKEKVLNIGEDFSFCRNLQKVGVKIHCDTELISGHLGSAVHVDEGYKQLYKQGKAP